MNVSGEEGRAMANSEKCMSTASHVRELDGTIAEESESSQLLLWIGGFRGVESLAKVH